MFDCARPVNVTNSVTVAGRSRSNRPKSSNASRDKAASSGAAGSGEGRRSPRATARISSFNSVMDLRIIVLLCLQIDLVGCEFEGAAVLGACPLDGSEEVTEQLIGTPELIPHQLLGVPKSMPMVVLLRARYTVSVVVPQQAGSIHVMQRDGVLDAMRPLDADVDFRDPKSDTPTIDEPVASMVVIQETGHRLIRHA